MTGYVRQDVGNNIENGEIADATYLDQEFDGIQAAFNSSSGHNHDGTTGEGAPITQLGPGQDFIASSSLFRPKTSATYDIGSASFLFKDLYLSGTVKATGGMTGRFYADLGSNALPSYSFIGDTDTGISAPNANSLVFSTSGAARVSISPAGNVNFTKSATMTEALTVTGLVTSTAGFSGPINASDLSSGTVNSARITGTYGNLTGTGALTAGSIASGFGTITSGAITSSGSITGNQNFVSSTNVVYLATTGTGTINLRPQGVGNSTGQLTLTSAGDVTVSGTLSSTGAISGPIDALNLTGTVANARLSGAYTGIIGVGTLTGLTAGNIVINGANVYNTADNTTSFIRISGGGGGNVGGNIEIFGSNHSTLANYIFYDANEHRFRQQDGSSNLARLTTSSLALGSNIGISFTGTGADTTRTNLGLGSIATLDSGTGSGDFRTNTLNDARFMIASNNLSQLTNLSTARTNLGLGSISTLDAGTGNTNFRNNSQNDSRFHISGVNTLATGDLPTDSAADSWVRARIAGGVNNALGTYALLRTVSNSGAVNTGTNVSGSDLYFASASDDHNSTNPAGTWKCMGYIPAGGGSAGQRTTLFLRVA